jgi:hypothetical protein
MNQRPYRTKSRQQPANKEGYFVKSFPDGSKVFATTLALLW